MSKTFKTTAVVGAALFLTACGGGGGSGGGADSASTTKVPTSSTMLSGTAAGGAALVGSVIVTDSKGATTSAAIATDGKYSVDVSGMTGPFVLKAAGTLGNTSVTYYSAATAADLGGTVNVTPFTDLIVSNIAAQLAVNYFADPANVAKIGSLITGASLAAAETALQAKLQPVLTAMGLGNSVDLLHQSFAADHSGLDAVLDLVTVSTNASTNVATFTNALTQVVIGTNNAAASAPDTTPVDSAKITGINPGAASNVQSAVTSLNAFAALFSTGLPSVTAIENSGLFDTSSAFLMSGQNFAQFASQLSNNPHAVGLKFSSVNVALDAAGTSGKVTAVLSSNYADFGGHITMNMLKDPVKGWVVQGNGQIANAAMQARAQLDHWSVLASGSLPANSGSNMLNGLHIYLDAFDYNSNHPSAMAVSAVLSGPGLPGAGINLKQDVKDTWFAVTAYSTRNGQDLIPECGTPMYSGYSMVTASGQCVDVSQVPDNSVYTVVLKDSGGNALNGAGDPIKVAKQPMRYSDLTASMFPNITATTIAGQPVTLSALVANANLAVLWTMPAGLVPDNTNMWADTSTGGSFFRVQQSGLSSTATQTILTLNASPQSSGTVSNFGVWLAGRDVYGRKFATSRAINSQ